MSLIYIYELFGVTASLYLLRQIFVELTYKTHIFEQAYNSAYITAIID